MEKQGEETRIQGWGRQEGRARMEGSFWELVASKIKGKQLGKGRVLVVICFCRSNLSCCCCCCSITMWWKNQHEKKRARSREIRTNVARQKGILEQ